jgi:hypothetical protein
MASTDSAKWKEAIAKEYASIERHKVFSLPCDLPAGATAKDLKLVLKLKEAADSTIERIRKARLCYRGFHQRLGIDYRKYILVAFTVRMRRMVKIYTRLYTGDMRRTASIP